MQKKETAAARDVISERKPGDARILQIDDDEVFLELTARRLQRKGYTVQSVTSWADAIPHLRGGQIDLCLLDVQLNSLSGDRLCEILKKTYPRLKVILYSSSDAERLRALTAQVGADGYLVKSADTKELLAVLQRFL